MDPTPAYLSIVSGLPAQVLELTPGTHVLGRSPTAKLHLDHLEVSRQHCLVSWDGERAIVEDLRSQKGTYLNGERIEQPMELTPGAKIGVGPALIEFGRGTPPVPSASGHGSSVAQGPAMLVRGQPADRVEITGELIIGRDPQADVVLSDPGVSRRHAKVQEQAGSGCLVTDLNSSAGSFVNGRRFDTQELTIGDRLQIGPFTFQYDGRALLLSASAAGSTITAVNVTVRAGAHTLLNGIDLQFPPAQFTGILGPSGAGKSTLLNVLAGLRTPSGGRVLVDGEDLYDHGVRRSFGYVPQEDIVHPELTVTQALHFSARLRLAASTPPSEMQKLIVQTLTQLGLRERADHPIHRLSGGQRKRVSVGVELLAKPPVLFLDEPSSGLDPATEFQLMELLRDLADTGCTIVCTTHVMEHAYLFDRLSVLVGGYSAFLGSAQEARDYFHVAKLTALYDRLHERAPAEWAKDAPHVRTPALPPSPVAPSSQATKFRRSFALPILLQRQWTILSADWRNFLILVGQPLIIGGLVSWVTNKHDLALFFAYVATLWFGCSNAAQEIVKELPIYRRERLVGVGAHTYLISKFAFLTVITCIQAALLYATLQLGEKGLDGDVGWQLLALGSIALAAVGIGSAISALARSVMQAVMVVPLVLIPQILFSGFTVPANEMEPPVRAVSQIMPSYASRTMVDTSFLWEQKIVRSTLSDYWTSYRNLDPEKQIKTGEVFRHPKAGNVALITQPLWALVMYLVAWWALRSREKQ
ncbi:MAG: FHA domain-containing protein [Chthoniobacteraceae bacterium]